MGIIDRLQLNMRLSAIEKDHEAISNAFKKLDEAKTPEEVGNAAAALSAAWHNR